MSFSIYLILYILAISGIFVIASFLITKYRSGEQFRFAIFSFLVGLWLALQLFAQIFHSYPESALLLLRISTSLACYIAFTFYVFVRYFTQQKTVSLKYIFLLVILSFLLLSPLGIKTASISQSGIAITSAGLAYYPYLFTVSTFFIVGVIMLLQFSRHAIDPSIKQRNKLLIIGILQAVIVIIGGSVLLADNIAAQILVPLSLLILVAFVAYAIIRHRLFDVRFIVVRSLGYLLSLGLITAIFSILVFGVSGAILRGNYPRTIQQLFYVTVTLTLVLTYPYIKRFFDKITNKLFYRDAYDTELFLSQLNQIIVSTIEINVLLKQISTLVNENLKSEACLFLIHTVGNSSGFRLVGSGSSDLDERTVRQFHHEITSIKSPIFLADDLSPQDPLLTFMRSHKIAVCVQLKTPKSHQKETVGYLLLGDKRSGNHYSQQDTRTIQIIANELVIAIQNTLRFEEIQQFNLTLQQKVDNATHKLRQTNEKLKALDETKDEFISMASHQLRTPLTSVKGYISMVVEGDAGKISETQKKLLDQAFTSSQRMVYLIADLLNVSRLKTGKFIIESKPTQLADVIETEISQLTETAKGRGLELTYDKPKNFPLLMLDETKTRQVIMNFADNAIYYTQSGTNRGHIHIGLEDKGSSIEFTVTDDGIGVPKAAQHHLFTKFYRADNAQHARPDGTGLGLFMAKKVIIAQGGALIFHSEEGKGSTFGFSFPKAKLLVPEPKK